MGKARDILPGEEEDAVAVVPVAGDQNFAPQRRFLDQTAGRESARQIEQLDRALGIARGLRTDWA